MDIVVPTYSGHIDFMKKFLETFSLNCEDKSNVTINLIVSGNDIDLFTKLTQEFQDLHIKIVHFGKLVEKYDNIVINEDELLRQIRKFNYQSLKKIFGALGTENEYVCIFDTECLFIRKFKLAEYIENNKNIYYYCSKMINNPRVRDTHAQTMQNSNNSLLCTNDPNWYLESYTWVFKRQIILELVNFLKSKYTHLTHIKQDFFGEYCYYLYARIHANNYPDIKWVDTMQVISDNMPIEHFNCWYEKTKPWCLMEHIGLYIHHVNFEHIESVCNIYDILKYPIMRLYENDKMNILFLLSCPHIKICVSDYCPLVYTLVKKDIFNKKIALCFSGFLRRCDNIDYLRNFIYPCNFDTYYYLSSEQPNVTFNLSRQKNVKSVIVDNSLPYYDTRKIKFPLPVKSDFVANTIKMLYKKSQFVKIAQSYDIIIHTRPDLFSFDKKLIDVIYDLMFKYNENTIYVTHLYNSVGLCDTFAAGSKQVMTHYFNLFNELDPLAGSTFFNSELYVYLHMKKRRFNILPLHWNYKINWHDNNLLDLWWRHEPYLELSDNFFDNYIGLKTESFQTILRHFNENNKKYIINHVKTKQNIFVTDVRNHDKSIIVSPDKFSTFFICHHENMTIRVNIIFDKTLENLNNNGTGWNIFTMPDNSSVYGKGNNGLWAQFYIIQEQNYYYIASIHSSHVNNKDGSFGRYIGIENGILRGDMPRGEDSQWYITPAK